MRCVEEKFIKCVDDITGQKLPWQAVKQVSEQELKYLRALGVWDKVEPHAAVQNTTSPKLAQSGSTLTKLLKESRCKSVHELLPESSEVVTGQNRMQELHRKQLWKPSNQTASHSPEFSLMYVDFSRACVHTKVQRLVLVKLPAEACSGKDKGDIGLAEEHVRYQRCSKQLGTRLARASRILGLRAGTQFRKSDPQREKENFGFDTRRRLCGYRNEGRSVAAQEAAGERKEHQGAESENTLERDSDIVSTRSPTS